MKATRTPGARPPRPQIQETDAWVDEDDDVEIDPEVEDEDIPLRLTSAEGREKLAVRRRIEQYWEEKRLRELLGDDLLE